MNADPYSPQRIADRMAIQDVMLQWCRAVDRLDRQGMIDAFHPEAIDDHGDYVGPAAGFADWVIARHKNIPFSGHVVANMLIEFASDDVALMETHMRTIRRYPAGSPELAKLAGGETGVGMDIFTSSRCVDRFERRDGLWRIAHRTLVQDWKQLAPVAAFDPKPQAGWVVGTRDRQDPVYLARKALGIS